MKRNVTTTGSETTSKRLIQLYQAHKRLTASLAIVIALMTIFTYPWFYVGPSFEGRVIDRQTGEPIAGVVVVMGVRGSGPGLIHGTRRKTLYLTEYVTDENGYYHFPYWISSFRPLRLHIGRSPTMGFYKNGYRPFGISNSRHVEGNLEVDPERPRERSELMGRWSIWVNFQTTQDPILLERFIDLEAELEAWKKDTSIMTWAVGYGLKCSWEQVPNLTIENDKRMRMYKKHLDREFHSSLQGTIDEWTFWKDEDCLDPKVYFKKYLGNQYNGENIK